MGISPNSSNIQSQQVGAFSLNSSNKMEAGNFVVTPYSNIYKFSLYDELHLDQDHYKEMHDIIFKNKIPKSTKHNKTKKISKNIIKTVLIIGSALLIFKHHTAIKNHINNLYNKIKNIFNKNH